MSEQNQRDKNTTFVDEIHRPTLGFHGPTVNHDMPCAVYHGGKEQWEESVGLQRKAVFNMNEGVFEPSWEAQDEGWMLVCVAPGWRRWLVKKLDSKVNKLHKYGKV